MPYIKKEWRSSIDVVFKYLSISARNGRLPIGEVNYLITKILLECKPKTYSDFNELVGVLECIKLEFYRRAIASYEDEKIKENGDVYDNR